MNTVRTIDSIDPNPALQATAENVTSVPNAQSTSSSRLARFRDNLNDSSWAGIIRNWLVGLVVLVWGGQGIYDRNFNQKEDSPPASQKLEEENTNQRKKIESLEEEIKKLKEGKEKKQLPPSIL